MAYRDFRLQNLEDNFGLKQANRKLFATDKTIVPSTFLVETIEKKSRSLRLTTEKAVSEAIIYPILAEIQFLNSDKITTFSGEKLVANKTLKLTGKIDFLIEPEAIIFEPNRPTISITQAKLHLAISKSFPQAFAQMLAMQLLNQNSNKIIHGIVTNGTQWIFMRLDGTTVLVDENEFLINDLPRLLGAIQTTIDFYQ